jgi:hypothetical protein
MPSELERIADSVREVGDSSGRPQTVTRQAADSARTLGAALAGSSNRSAASAAAALQVAHGHASRASGELATFGSNAGAFADRLASGGGSGAGIPSQGHIGGAEGPGESAGGQQQKLSGLLSRLRRSVDSDPGSQLSSHPEILDSVNGALKGAKQSLERWDSADRERSSRWFGNDSDQTRTRLTQMLTAMERVVPEITLHPFEPRQAGPESYAYVYPSDSQHRVFVGDLFWQAGQHPPDAKAGVILHELSHFNDVDGTGDHWYTIAVAREFAENRDSRAIDNADNIEYFLEEFLP